MPDTIVTTESSAASMRQPTGSTADANGEIRLRFQDLSDDLFCAVQSLSVRSTQGVITIAGAASGVLLVGGIFGNAGAVSDTGGTIS